MAKPGERRVQENESLAQSQARQALEEWAKDAGISLDSLVLVNPVQQGSFFISGFNLAFNVSGSGGMRSIARMMWALETSKIPMRVSDIKISPTREGTDELSVKLMVSTIFTAPEASGDLADATGGRQ